MKTRKQFFNHASLLMVTSYASCVVNIAKNIVLARCIAPEYFGLMAMSLVYVGITYRFHGFWGQRLALLHAPDEHQSYQAHFLLSLVMVLASLPLVWGGVFFFEAEHRSQVYVLTLIIMTFSLLELVSMTCLHHLEKKLSYRRIAMIRLVSLVWGLAITAFFLIKGFYLTTLVVDRVAAITLASCLYWRYSGWRPTWVWPKETLRWFIAYGKGLWIIELVVAVNSQLVEFVIGRWMGLTSLAFYSKSSSYAKMPLITVVQQAIGVVLPVYAKYQNDRKKTTMSLLSFARVSLGAMGLIYGFLVLTADPLITLVLGAAWSPIIPLFRLFCVVYFFKSYTDPLSDYLSVTGRQAVSIKAEVLGMCVGLIGIPAAAYVWGLTGVALGQMVVVWAGIVYLCRFLAKEQNVLLRPILLRNFLCITLSLGAAWGLDYGLWNDAVRSSWIVVIERALLYGAIYSSAWVVSEWRELRALYRWFRH